MSKLITHEEILLTDLGISPTEKSRLIVEKGFRKFAEDAVVDQDTGLVEELEDISMIAGKYHARMLDRL